MNRPFWRRQRPAQFDPDFQDCGSVELLLSLYADGMASPAESGLVESHLVTCAGCREAMAWMQATHRALAGRPVVTPPANLQARIAEAIAASSTAPGPLSPVRTFKLRPAYAAAASLTVVGVVLGYSLLHHPAPPLTTVPPISPQQLAVQPTVKPRPAIANNVNHRPRATVYPLPARDERVASETGRPAETVPPVRTQIAPPRSQFRPRPVVATTVKYSLRPSANEPPPVKPNGPLFASIHFGVTPPKRLSTVPSVVTPKPSPSVVEASALPKTTLPHSDVPVHIQTPVVTTQPEAVHTQLASDILGNVHAKVASLRSEGFATIMKSANRTMSSVPGFDAEKSPTVDITHGDIR